MSTAKKVAPKVLSLKKDAKAVSIPKNKKPLVSSVKAKPQSKKPIKVAIADKTTSQPRKKKSVQPTHSKKLHSKFTALEALHSKNQTQLSKKSESQLIRTVATRPSFSLTLLSPYRFPLAIDKHAIKTARFGGVFFVVMGALATLFFANGAFSVGSQTAQVHTATYSVASTSLTTPVPGTVASLNCQDPLLYQSVSCKDSVNTKPDASFEVANRDADLKGTVKIKVVVAYAQRVKLLALNRTNGTSLDLGLMKSVSPDAWEFYWNTSVHTDGEYRLRVLVQNGHGSYEDVDTANVTVENTPFENTTSSSTQQSIQTNPTDTVVDEQALLKPKLTSNVLESTNEFRFEITDPKADSIKMYAFHVPTSKKMLLGNMYATTNDVFKYRWLTGTQEVGEYKIIAQILTDGVPTYSSELLVKKIPTEAVAAVVAQNILPVEEEKLLDPEVSISLPSNGTLSGSIPLQIRVKNAALVELYAQGKSSLIKKYLGIATLVDSDTWTYRFDTKQVPDGEYILLASIKNTYGSYEHRTQSVRISNVVATAYTPVQIEKIKTLETVGTDATKMSSTSRTVLTIPIEKTSEVVNENLEQDAKQTTVPKPLITSEENSVLQTELKLLANALRLKDESVVNEIKARILKLKESRSTTNDQNDVKNQQNSVALDSFIRGLILQTEEDVFATEKLITERTKEKASEDTDKDGVSNYDEVVIYKTDPFNSDTDNDGFGDSAEILNGYNPTDAKPEALVSYESPKEAGIVREDILEVTSITAAAKDEDTAIDIKRDPVAIISGTALPNSFITLYIFSTPIVVTIKTDEDGGWNYRFDKELEDGEHEVYVGVTDNAGKIVAKSNPFAFVKEAEAFTGLTTSEDTEQPTPITVPKSFLSDYMVYLVLSISTVAIGLVLILLGLHLDSRQQKFGIVTRKDESLV